MKRSSAARAGQAFQQLVATMAALRAPRGCPWDRKQSHETLRSFLLEETYEALDAIDRGDLDGLRGELGDVLFQCVFHAQVAAEHGNFDMTDVVRAVTAKLVRRHPHVFAASGKPLTTQQHRRRSATTPAAVLEQWERLKAREQEHAGGKARLLAGIPRSLPALLRAHKIGSRAATVGFDWPTVTGVLEKIEEEVRELRAALSENPDRAREEMGDLLFSLANLARKLRIEPELALAAANDKFTRRFEAVEALLETGGRDIHSATLAEMEAAWQTVKYRPATPAPATSVRSSSSRSTRGRRSRQ